MACRTAWRSSADSSHDLLPLSLLKNANGIGSLQMLHVLGNKGAALLHRCHRDDHKPVAVVVVRTLHQVADLHPKVLCFHSHLADHIIHCGLHHAVVDVWVSELPTHAAAFLGLTANRNTTDSPVCMRHKTSDTRTSQQDTCMFEYMCVCPCTTRECACARTAAHLRLLICLQGCEEKHGSVTLGPEPVLNTRAHHNASHITKHHRLNERRVRKNDLVGGEAFKYTLIFFFEFFFWIRDVFCSQHPRCWEQNTSQIQICAVLKKGSHL